MGGSDDDNEFDNFPPPAVSLQEARSRAQTLAGFYQNNPESDSAEFQLKFIKQHVAFW